MWLEQRQKLLRRPKNLSSKSLLTTSRSTKRNHLKSGTSRRSLSRSVHSTGPISSGKIVVRRGVRVAGMPLRSANSAVTAHRLRAISGLVEDRPDRRWVAGPALIAHGSTDLGETGQALTDREEIVHPDLLAVTDRALIVRGSTVPVEIGPALTDREGIVRPDRLAVTVRALIVRGSTDLVETGPALTGQEEIVRPGHLVVTVRASIVRDSTVLVEIGQASIDQASIDQEEIVHPDLLAVTVRALTARVATDPPDLLAGTGRGATSPVETDHRAVLRFANAPSGRSFAYRSTAASVQPALRAAVGLRPALRHGTP